MNEEPLTASIVNDWSKFKPHLLPKCSVEATLPKKFLLIIVKSAAVNIPNRNAIRATWGAVSSYSGFTVKTVFVVAQLQSHVEKRMGDVLEAEANEHGDLLIGEFHDHYRNNTLKFLTAVQFAHNYCARVGIVPFAFFVDDDYFVSIPNLIGEIEKWKPDERLYMGWRFDTTPFRFRFIKHRVSLAVYPYDRYPPYISAGAVLLSRQSIRELYLAIQHVNLFNYDDIYAGILAYLLSLPVTHNEQMHFWYHSVSGEDLHSLICAHGYYGQVLRQKYTELKLSTLLKG